METHTYIGGPTDAENGCSRHSPNVLSGPSDLAGIQVSKCRIVCQTREARITATETGLARGFLGDHRPQATTRQLLQLTYIMAEASLGRPALPKSCFMANPPDKRPWPPPGGCARKVPSFTSVALRHLTRAQHISSCSHSIELKDFYE